MKPSAAPTTGGTAPPAQASATVPNDGPIAVPTPSQGGLFAGGTPQSGFTTPTPIDSKIFGDATQSAGSKPYDVPAIPHGHSLHAALHVIASQSPMTFPLAEFLVIKMRSYYPFEKHPPMPVRAQLSLPTGPGFNIELDPAKVEAQRAPTFA